MNDLGWGRASGNKGSGGSGGNQGSGGSARMTYEDGLGVGYGSGGEGVRKAPRGGSWWRP
ncbi:hypothetical protein [Streptomyces sp. NPDC047043]|uniref:hypothetical protein n=1 Tax=Streptomyces sp. NPDC047043 TaxID=3154497 RepID=UPI0033CDF9EA